jgi:hypothetical protein
VWLAIEMITKLVPVLHHPEGTRIAHPGGRPRRGPRSAAAAGPQLPAGVEERWLEPLFLRAHRPLRAVGRRRGAAGAPVASSPRG